MCISASLLDQNKAHFSSSGPFPPSLRFLTSCGPLCSNPPPSLKAWPQWTKIILIMSLKRKLGSIDLIFASRMPIPCGQKRREVSIFSLGTIKPLHSRQVMWVWASYACSFSSTTLLPWRGRSRARCCFLPLKSNLRCLSVICWFPK